MSKNLYYLIFRIYAFLVCFVLIIALVIQFALLTSNFMSFHYPEEKKRYNFFKFENDRRFVESLGTKEKKEFNTFSPENKVAFQEKEKVKEINSIKKEERINIIERIINMAVLLVILLIHGLLARHSRRFIQE